MEPVHIEMVYQNLRKDLTVALDQKEAIMKKQKIVYMTYAIFPILVIGYLTYVLAANNTFQTAIYIDGEYQRTSNNIYYYFVIAIFSFYFFYKRLASSFSREFSKFRKRENEAISLMARQLFPSFRFSQELQLSSQQLKASKIFNWIAHNDSVHTYGTIKNTHDGIPVHIADIGILHKKDLSGLVAIPYMGQLIVLFQLIEPIKYAFSKKTADNLLYSFRGMFCSANFPKCLVGYTIVLPKSISTKKNRWLVESIEDEPVQLEDIRFSEDFLVYATDQVEARYVLSTTLMERIVEFKERSGQNIMLSFLHNTMYVAIENAEGIFSFPSGDISSMKVLEEIVAQINLTKYIVQDFNLNRKIFKSFNTQKDEV